MFSSLNLGDKIDENLLNEALKKLYYTDYFKVKLSVKDQTVNISVVENPIIQTVIIEGVNRDSLYEKIEDITKKIEKYPFVENKISEASFTITKFIKIIWILFC